MRLSAVIIFDPLSHPQIQTRTNQLKHKKIHRSQNMEAKKNNKRNILCKIYSLKTLFELKMNLGHWMDWSVQKLSFSVHNINYVDIQTHA